MRYDPSRPPPREWQELDEDEQAMLVADYHGDLDLEPEGARLHCLAHVIVENQVLLGDETPTKATLLRLRAEGLSRHDAIHAIGSRLMGLMWEATTSRVEGDLNESYGRELAGLTAAGWLAESGDESSL